MTLARYMARLLLFLARICPGNPEEVIEMWIKPSFRDLRFGMEVTMYILSH